MKGFILYFFLNYYFLSILKCNNVCVEDPDRLLRAAYSTYTLKFSKGNMTIVKKLWLLSDVYIIFFLLKKKYSTHFY